MTEARYPRPLQDGPGAVARRREATIPDEMDRPEVAQALYEACLRRKGFGPLGSSGQASAVQQGSERVGLYRLAQDSLDRQRAGLLALTLIECCCHQDHDR